MSIRNILFTVSVFFLLSSCDFVTKAYKETFDKQQTGDTDAPSENNEDVHEHPKLQDVRASRTAVEDINLLADAEKLGAVQQQLQRMFPEKTLSIFPPHIYFETARIRLQLVDPDIPENIDWYYYKAETDAWQKEEPVKTSVRDRRKPIQLDAIKFGTANSVYDQVIKKSAEIEGAKAPTTVYFSFHVPVWNWNARIVGSRSDYEFKADIDGKEIEFKRQ